MNKQVSLELKGVAILMMVYLHLFNRKSNIGLVTDFCYINDVPLVYYIHEQYLQPIITQYFIDNKSEIWLLFLIAHSKR